MSTTPTYLEPPPDHSGLRTALVAGALIALVAANIYLYVQIDHVRTDMSKMHESMMTELTNLRDASSVNTASETRHIDTLKEELDNARSQARQLSSQAKAEATARAEQLAKELAAAQAKQQQALTSEISNVKQASDTANANLTAKIGDVSTDVGGVKTQLGSTQAELQKTIAQLKSVQGDLGVQSGLIATNGVSFESTRYVLQEGTITTFNPLDDHLYSCSKRGMRSRHLGQTCEIKGPKPSSSSARPPSSMGFRA